MTEAVRANVARFTPALLRRDLQPFDGAVMFADISGFTTLSEELAQAGVAGAEKLSELLDHFFERLIGFIDAHGGHVIRIAGDAPLVVWEGPDAPARAARCALALQTQQHPSGLSLRIALAAGRLELLSLGGVNDRWEWLLWGECLRGLDPAGKLAKPGEVVAAPGPWEGERLEDGFVRLRSAPPGAAQPLPARPLPSEEEAAWLLRYLPLPARLRLEAGLEGWLAELRRITVMFVNLRGEVDLQRAVTAIQEVLARHEGSLNQFLVDDKGTVCLAAFGLPPRAHHDDPVRALRAALDLQQRLENIDVGLATGQLFCGPRGGSTRREYCMIGSRVNLAARLMQAASGGILCDDATFNGARHALEFDFLPPLKVKGREEPLPVYRPLGELDGTPGVLPLVGRDAELAQLLSVRGLVWLEGEAGLGKSRLLAEVVRRTPDALVARATAVGSDTPYQAWLSLPLAARLAGDPRLPLLTGGLEHVTGPRRAEATRELLADLAASCELLIVEDAHWLDAASWEALFHLQGRARVIVSTRPQPVPPELRPDLVLKLTPLSEEATRALVSQLPGAPDPGPWLEKAQGNPFFAQELALAVAEGLSLPDSLQALVVSRIDRLLAQQQLALKVASVLGQRFSLVDLGHLYPVADDLPAHARALEEREFVLPHGPGELEFRHDVTREVAYGLLLHSQRRELHRQAAEWLADSGLHPLLAYHWKGAGDTARAVHHLDVAGEEAHRNGLYRSAIGFLEEARALGSPEAHRLRVLGEAYHAAGALPAARATLEECARLLRCPVPRGWRLWLDFNMLSMALALACRFWFPLGLRWLEKGMKATLALTPKVPPADVERRREGCACHEALSVVYAFGGDMLASMHCGARTWELIAGCPPCPELARATANSAMGLGLIGMDGLADELGRQAVAMPESHADLVTRTSILHYCSMPLAITGRWEDALRYMGEAETLLERSGSRRQRAEMLAFLGYISFYRGDLDGFQEAFRRVRPRSDDEHYQAWIHFTELFARWVRGTPPQLAEVAPLRASDALLQANLHGLAALAAGKEALGHVEALLACNAPAEMAFYTSTAYEMATVALAGLPVTSAAARCFGTVLGRLRTVKAFIPVAEPLWWLAQARREEWWGRSGARARERGRAAARRWCTPRYEGLLAGQVLAAEGRRSRDRGDAAVAATALPLRDDFK